ncbi:hypothetical protein Np050604_114 [Cyanophage S-RIM44]|uniref:Uncharacterized protein n=2 Tax=Vellamovirus TaxID=2733139 RepID=A0A127KN40_9CAUD|nr:hypothetical protein Syn1_115 [Prochlorococcus phage Syn1]AMO43358.1 hypothetical protein W270710_114 [Cyanophage S-RIM44]ADO99216.1 hypothetical protein Syn1_115 [Prochlorococcus phage Syn1]AOO11830.1 hypothetical protein Np050604_114 [Cyanophage S-RIM44]AOO12531.1 hypothetical protein Sn080709_114 [Cyanophage S-RIM44]AOO12997.1 hypothetical protein W2100709_115 [Cyanophage S-RIM44]
MTNDKELSNLRLERKECPKCGATWINGKHVFRGTAASYNKSELDLAGLVCNNLGDETCINPSKGIEGGQTWERRAGYVDGAIEANKGIMKDMRDQFGDL